MVMEEVGAGETAELVVKPARRVDVGAGRGKVLETKIYGGVVGTVLDGRGRPLEIPKHHRSETVARWARALDAYPA